MTLAGKNAVITGSGRGIGRAIALTLAKQGCSIGINYLRHRSAAERTAREVEALGVRSAIVKAHIGRDGEAERLVESCAMQLGGIDIFVGNAASGVQKPILAIDSKAWDWTMNINARSILQGVQAVAPHMRENKWGRVITITSPGSRSVFPDYGMVGTSKAALETLTRYMAVELAPHGITTNCISPGLVLTDALDSFPQQKRMITAAQQNTPAGRLVAPEDIGKVVVWLCSDDAQMIVGQTITIDGGHGLVAG